jgi:hypothetical protein
VTDEISEVNTFQLAILRGLQRKPVFQGLTEQQWDKVAKRRAKNKVADRTRRLSRKLRNARAR